MRTTMSLAVLVVTLAVPAHAQQQPSKQDICRFFEAVAETIMTGRQSGMPMSENRAEIQKLADKSHLSAQATAITDEMLAVAYEKPRFSSKEKQDKSILDFKNDQFLICTKASQG